MITFSFIMRIYMTLYKMLLFLNWVFQCLNESSKESTEKLMEKSDALAKMWVSSVVLPQILSILTRILILLTTISPHLRSKQYHVVFWQWMVRSHWIAFHNRIVLFCSDNWLVFVLAFRNQINKCKRILSFCWLSRRWN